MRILGASFLLIFTSALPALAAETPAPSPTPYPPQQRPGEVLPDALPDPTPSLDSAAVGAYPEPAPIAIATASPRRAFREAPAGGLLPTVGVNVGFHFQKVGPATMSFPIWAGVQMKPLATSVAPYSAVGAEFELFGRQDVDGRSGTVTSVVPELRFGVSVGGPGSDLATRLFPWLNLYAITGYRVPNERLGDGGGTRLGLGISSPALMALGVATECTPVPSTVEIVSDYDMRTGIHTTSLRYGFQF